MNKRSGEYEIKGDYHKDLDPNWPYLPVYLEKMSWIEDYLSTIPKSYRILDAGCGEGLLVKKFREAGWNITGYDLNYQSEYVIQGDLLDIKFGDGSFNMILCLDVLEHISFENQGQVLREFSRLLKPGGTLVLSVPNLAHMASRLSFMFTGNLVRTSTIDRHPGDRPSREYNALICENFTIEKVTGIFPTFPILSLLTLKIPSKIVWLHRIYNRVFPFPGIGFLNIFECKKDA